MQALTPATAFAQQAAGPTQRAQPLLTRIRIATVGAPNVAQLESRYAKWLGYTVRERGKVSRARAESWGAPKAAGRAYVLMNSAGWPNEFIRIVQVPPVKGYRIDRPMSTFGWNAIEIIVDDSDGLREKFRAAPFKVIGEPQGLERFPSIRAFQVVGSVGEVLYLTTETGDRRYSILPQPNGPVGRTFIMVVGGPDFEAMRAFYSKHFRMTIAPARNRKLDLLQQAQGLPADRELPMSTGRLVQHGNMLQFDGYSEKATPRPQAKGDLPPGIAMTSFGIGRLESAELSFVGPPVSDTSLAYGGKRSATARGPSGELIELIEE